MKISLEISLKKTHTSVTEKKRKEKPQNTWETIATFELLSVL